jgi:hypothetical protein
MRSRVHQIARAAVTAGVIGLCLGGAARAFPPEGKIWPDPRNAPNVFAGGTLFAFSGLDGKTTAADVITACPLTDGIGLKFHLPKDPVVRIRLRGDVAPQWQVASNDMLMAKVPNDDWSVVVVFLAPNVIGGYLPAGARISVEGGDGNFMILRKEIGERLRFSVAYDPHPSEPEDKGPPPSLMEQVNAIKLKGPPKTVVMVSPALKAVNLGMNLSIETAIDSRLDFFAKLPPPPVELSPVEGHALAKAFSIMKACVLAPEAPVQGRWIVADRWPDNNMTLRDTAIGVMGVMHTDPALAKELLMNFVAAQMDTGFIPGRLGPGVKAEDVAAGPPLVAHTAWQLYNFEKIRDAAFLQKTFDAAQKNVIWFMKNRRIGGEPPPTESLEYGTPLYFWKSAAESGMAESPRFEGGGEFAAIDLSCYLANECYSLQAMAQKIGYRELAKTWGTRGDAIAKAARDQLWDQERGFFFDRKGAGGERGAAFTVAGLLPLWAGIATQAQADRLREHLASKKFATPVPLPSLARDDVGYKTESWRGPVWPWVDYLVYRGLERYGYDKEAADMRAKLLATVGKYYGQTSALYEFYDADDATAPADLQRKALATMTPGSAPGGTGPTGAAPDFMPTAAVYIDLVLRPR